MIITLSSGTSLICDICLRNIYVLNAIFDYSKTFMIFYGHKFFSKHATVTKNSYNTANLCLPGVEKLSIAIYKL